MITVSGRGTASHRANESRSGTVSQMRSRSSARRALCCGIAALALATAGACSKVAEENVPGSAAETAEARQGTVGTTTTYDGVSLTVTAISSFPQSTGGFPRLRIVIRSENVRGDAAANPGIDLRCDEDTEVAQWDVTSTWRPLEGLPANVVREGELIVRFPPKTSNARYPTATCTNARIVLLIGGHREPKRDLVFAVPAATIDEAVGEPRGRQ